LITLNSKSYSNSICQQIEDQFPINEGVIYHQAYINNWKQMNVHARTMKTFCRQVMRYRGENKEISHPFLDFYYRFYQRVAYCIINLERIDTDIIRELSQSISVTIKDDPNNIADEKIDLLIKQFIFYFENKYKI
jgi:hypothetical protein